jgi:hypothetical protein
MDGKDDTGAKIVNWLRWYWPFALAFIALVLFGIPEFIAVQTNGETFSQFMANMYHTKFGGIWVFGWGALVGGLLVHFTGWCVNCKEDGK